MNFEEETAAKIATLEERIESVGRRVPGGQERIRSMELQIYDHETRIAELEVSAQPSDIDLLPRITSVEKSEDERAIIETVAHLSEEGDGRAYIPDIVAALMPRRSLEDITKTISKLKRSGEIFEPRQGWLKMP